MPMGTSFTVSIALLAGSAYVRMSDVANKKITRPRCERLRRCAVLSMMLMTDETLVAVEAAIID